jgi:hypothetical protein
MRLQDLGYTDDDVGWFKDQFYRQIEEPVGFAKFLQEETMAAKKKPKLGSGARFKAVAASARKSGARNPKAVAAAVGRAKYGKAKMAKLAAAGRRRKS